MFGVGGNSLQQNFTVTKVCEGNHSFPMERKELLITARSGRWPDGSRELYIEQLASVSGCMLERGGERLHLPEASCEQCKQLRPGRRRSSFFAGGASTRRRIKKSPKGKIHGARCCSVDPYLARRLRRRRALPSTCMQTPRARLPFLTYVVDRCRSRARD